jgi:hypothetical protein
VSLFSALLFEEYGLIEMTKRRGDGGGMGVIDEKDSNDDR